MAALREEIQKVLELNKAGKLTDDQAADLLTELSEKSSSRGPAQAEPAPVQPEQGPSFSASGSGAASATLDRGSIEDLVRDVVGAALKGLGAAREHGEAAETEKSGEDEAGHESPWNRHHDHWNRKRHHHRGRWMHGCRDNHAHLSRVVEPKGESFEFADNQMHLSSVTEITLNRAQMKDNSINASRISRLTIEDGRMLDCQVHGSSVDTLSLQASQLEDSSFHGSKWTRVSLENGSVMKDCELNGSAIKELKLASATTWNNVEANGSHISEVTVEGSLFHDVEMNGVSFSEVRFQGCKLHDFKIQGLSVRKSSFVNADLHDVGFGVEGGWKSWLSGSKAGGLDGVQIENCKLSDIRFVGCRFNRVIIRNVTLSDQKFRDIVLSDQVIDGNEAFLAAMQAGARK